MPKRKFTLELDSELIQEIEKMCADTNCTVDQYVNFCLQFDSVHRNEKDSVAKSEALRILVNKAITKYKIEDEVSLFNKGKMTLEWDDKPSCPRATFSKLSEGVENVF
jgi:hypothetical protein